ncbi:MULTISPECIES: Ku protein [unclassified Pseudactinotalea]|uniref:non-homologous end joining protein Ku n=1 Tax=unclassified Pseudactinotalea TaxID=2649176 RepID=UPI00128DC398|nr:MULTISPECIES: Ku protein [unclassified Pseudactinotalea]MPV48586.1 Ku protein [Pseudactinotalea sp. HY160]QGH68558.1 Ku protein [Pseudactinotalea sp. HY158]
MRAIWSGAIAFGLVNVPVKAYAATSDHDVHLHQVHDRDGGRIRYERRCEVCGDKVEYAHIDRAYDDGEKTVVLAAEDLGSLPAAQRREIEVVQFVPSAQIEPITLSSSYYLSPDPKAAKAYTLLRRTLESSDVTAVVTFALRQRTNLGVLRVHEGVLVLQAMIWPDELREVDPPEEARVSERELGLAADLVDQLRGDFDADSYEDTYQVELRTLIDAKLTAGESVDTAATFGEVAAETEDGGTVIDLMEALRRSIDARRKPAQGA